MKMNKCSNLVCNFIIKNYVVHITASKQTLNHGPVKFNQKAGLKPYIGMSTTLKSEAKNDFEKDFFKLMNNSVFGKTMRYLMKAQRY